MCDHLDTYVLCRLSEKETDLQRVRSELDGHTAKVQTLQQELDAQKKKNDVSCLPVLLQVLAPSVLALVGWFGVFKY